MKSIAIMNLKGGVGKTVTAINLADILTRDYGRRVLLIDCDGQCNLTRTYLPDLDTDEVTNTTTLLLGEGEPVWSDNVIDLGRGLSLLPASTDLYELDRAALQDGVRRLRVLYDFVRVVEEDREVDYCILDCPPGYTVASINALLACDEVVIPMLVDGFSFLGMGDMRAQIANLQNARRSVRVAGVLITQWRNADVVHQGEALLRRMNVPVFDQVIRRTDKVPESTFERQPVTLYSPTSAATQDYRAWVREYLGEELGDGQV